MKEIITDIFKQIDGYTCRIKSGGLLVQGSTELECLLSYHEYQGLSIKSLLKWNDNKPQDLILPTLNKHLRALNDTKDKKMAFISFDARDQIFEALNKSISEMYITVGLISLYGAQWISCQQGKDDTIYSVQIRYENATVEIYALSKKAQS